MPRRASTRKSVTAAKDANLEKEPSPDAKIEEEAPSSSSRPRRNARRSVLYHNDAFETQMLGQNKDEPSTDLKPTHTPRNTRARAAAAPPQLSPMTAPEFGSETAPAASTDTSTEPASVTESISNQLGSPQMNTTQKRSGLDSDMLRGSKRRKVPPHLAETMDESEKVSSQTVEEKGQSSNAPEINHFDESLYTEGSNLVVGAEYELPHDDDGPPVLGPIVDFHDDGHYAASNDDSDEEAPNLERNQLTKRRGRPRRAAALSKADDKTDGDAVKIKLTRPSTRILRVAQGEKTATSAANANQRNVKLFETDLETTPNGEAYAVVVNGCLAELLRKERIIDLLTNPSEIDVIREAGWLLDRPPRLPPLTTEKVCYAFYVDGTKVISPKDLSNDDLRPWSATVETSQSHFLNIKPNVRRHPVCRQNGKLVQVKMDPRLAELHLTEYSARLPRDLRLRKKIFYLSKDNQLYGNALILYDYTSQGIAPTVVSLPHGNDLLRGVAGREVDDGIDDEVIFEQQVVEGSRGGLYLKLRPNKIGWMQNKKQLIDYLYNKQDILRQENVLNGRIPDLPPLIETVGVFVYFVPADCVLNQIHHAYDGLSPWTTAPNSEGVSARVRSTRRALCEDPNGILSLSPDPQNRTEWALVETMSTLARCKRVRKRVCYVQRQSGAISGLVCYIYEFLYDGPIPELFTQADLKQYQADQKWNVEGGHQKKSQMQSQLLNTAPYGSLEMDGIGDPELIDNTIIVDHDPNDPLLHEADELQTEHMQMELIETHMEDTLNGGYDDEFMEDPTEKLDNPEPFYDLARELESGMVYLTVRHKKMATSFETVLEYIVNSNVVEERGLLNPVKPGHPPIVSNARAYAFFVAGSAIFPHDINRDDFSPWSHNGSANNPTCYRTKVRKFGVVCDNGSTNFQLRDTDYKSCPFHLVYLYSISPREPRMRKKIYYLMETQSKMVVSHALIIYDYNAEGNLPRTNNGQMKTYQKRTFRNAALQHHDVYNDVSDLSEGEKECPFLEPPEVMPDGTCYMQVTDNDFWNDRNRQINFIANHPMLLDQLDCLNNKVPDMPPPCTTKGTFAFFINGEEVGFRALTTDKLVPWSENICSNPMGTTKRPKSSKVPLGLNRQNQLRVWKANNAVSDQVEYLLHVYTATLPRCTRLRKKVVYVQKDGRQFGHALIMYSFTEHGDMPEPVVKTFSASDFISQISPTIRDHIYELLKTNNPADVSKIVYHEHGMQIHVDVLNVMRQREPEQVETVNETVEEDTMWTNADGAGPSTSSAKDMEIPHEEIVVTENMITGEEMVVEHTEVIEQMDGHYVDCMAPANPFLNKTMGASGFVRGSQRYDALWRIAQKHFGTTEFNDTFDQWFKLLHEKNEARLLQSINNIFNVDIYPSGAMIVDEEVVENGHYIPIGDADPNILQEEEQIYTEQHKDADI